MNKINHITGVSVPTNADEIGYVYVNSWAPLRDDVPPRPYGHLKEGEIYIVFKDYRIMDEDAWAVWLADYKSVPQPYWIIPCLSGDDNTYKFDLELISGPDFDFTRLKPSHLEKLEKWQSEYNLINIQNDTDMQKYNPDAKGNLSEEGMEELKAMIRKNLGLDKDTEFHMIHVDPDEFEKDMQAMEAKHPDPSDLTEGDAHQDWIDEKEADDVARLLEAFLSIPNETDQPFRDIVINLIEYIATTYSDKYQGEENQDHFAENFSKMAYLMSKSHGKGANCFTASKYIQRYCTTGYKKSDNPVDVQKAIHFLMFELERRNRHQLDSK